MLPISRSLTRLVGILLATLAKGDVRCPKPGVSRPKVLRMPVGILETD